MPYVRVAPGGRYFMTEDGAPFLVIGHNEAMPWPALRPLYKEEDVGAVDAYLRMLAAHGVTVLRIMLEYCQDECWLFDDPQGCPEPEVVRYWDNLIGLCERHKLRLLVTFWDTFFMSRRWEHHPYSRPESGFAGPGSFCISPTAFAAQQTRIRFFVDRWGNSPAIFAYDLLNEIHPYWGGSPADQHRWVTAIAQFIKQYEQERWGKRHLVTVSIFGAQPEEGYWDLIFRHPELDFATTHVYEFGVVDNPDNTVDGATTMRAAVRFALERITEVRPYIDTESGPIHAFMDLGRSLPEAFDDEFYHNMSWAHLATGGAGSGMRWPFRHPHTLTPGMHAVQQGMARFVSTLAWTEFTPQPIDDQLAVVARAASDAGQQDSRLPVVPFGCSDGRQALVWLLRDVRAVAPDAALPAADLMMPDLMPGTYVAEFWETYEGVKTGEINVWVEGGEQITRLPLPAFSRDVALAIKQVAIKE
jgi:mannan endo-1,4-beta-mannosidase